MSHQAAVLQRHQPHWDWRAAANFMCGGAGAGLVLFTLFAKPAAAAATPWLLAAGLGLVGLGLFFVWLEIGRPWRALNVFVNVRRSWMSREAWVAVLLFLLGGGLLLGMHWRAWPTAVAAAAFLYCQARILGEARAIPAWRDALTPPLLIATGLTEGAGLFWLLAAGIAYPWGFYVFAVAALLAVLALSTVPAHLQPED